MQVDFGLTLHLEDVPDAQNLMIILEPVPNGDNRDILCCSPAYQAALFEAADDKKNPVFDSFCRSDGLE